MRTCKLTHHGSWDAKQLTRLPVQMPKSYDGSKLVVKVDGVEVPYQVEVLAGTLKAVTEGYIWVYASIKSLESQTYSVTMNATPSKFRPMVVSRKRGNVWMLNNGLISVGVGVSGNSGPIAWIKPAGGKQRGSSKRITQLKLRKVTVKVCDTGPLFRKVRVRQQFDPGIDGQERFSEYVVTLAPGVKSVTIEENHQMNQGDSWQFDISTGWGVKKAFVRGWYTAIGRFGKVLANSKVRTVNLKGNDRLGKTATFLQPSWTTNPDVSWFFGAADDATVVAAVATRASKWRRPAENRIDCQTHVNGEVLLSLPTYRGSRQWMLIAGPSDIVRVEKLPNQLDKNKSIIRDHLLEMVFAEAVAPLDKLMNEYILDWSGRKPGGLFAPHFYEDVRINPLGAQRGIGNGLVRQALSGKMRGDRRSLSGFQVYLDPDFIPWYRNNSMPPKPYLATKMLRIPVAQCAALKKHPQFKVFTKMASDALKRDLYNSIALPSGASQDSPANTASALVSWLEIAEICRKNLGFNPRSWPRFKAAGAFLLHTSLPLANGKRQVLPFGEISSAVPNIITLAKRAGVTDDVSKFKTEELPGFGVIFRSRSGSDQEAFLAFKAGPSRAGNHGDQLSFHYCRSESQLAIDHMPKDGISIPQEHMHNRLAIGDWENMDGYERLIAFTTGRDIDVAVGQVESSRLREMFKLPRKAIPFARHQSRAFSTPIVYRRTITFIKNPSNGTKKDYFVIRDQYTGPELPVTYCLHVDAKKANRNGQIVEFDDKMMLFFMGAEKLKFSPFDWEYKKHGSTKLAKTSGVRIRSAGKKVEFITVLICPDDGKYPQITAADRGVRIDFGDGNIDEVTFANANDEIPSLALVKLNRNGKTTVALTEKDIDLNRNQGETGLLVDESSDLGEVPRWLIRQRGENHKSSLIHKPQQRCTCFVGLETTTQ